MRPHHPFPSLIRFSNPILFPAASIPVVFLSKPSVVLFKVSVSVAKDSLNWVLEALSACASVRREVVRFADSESLWARRVEAVVFFGSGCVLGGGLEGANLFRSPGIGSVDSGNGGSEGSGFCAGGGEEGWVSPSISSSSSGP